jgi:hypothetical protein
MTENHPPTTTTHADGVVLRRLEGDDLRSVDRLAHLDSRRPPRGPLLGAEIEGRLVAAISLQTGEAIADPFSRTVEVRALLELRAAQIRRRQSVRRRRPRRVSRPRARAALAGSPPGAPAWLMRRGPF